MSNKNLSSTGSSNAVCQAVKHFSKSSGRGEKAFISLSILLFIFNKKSPIFLLKKIYF
jgi:hypothetical protein